MSTKLEKSAPATGHLKVQPDEVHVAVVGTEWNAAVIEPMLAQCVKSLKAAGLVDDDIATYRVPGAIELTFAASQLIESSAYDAIIVLGCVIRGDTPHFDYVCQSVTQGITGLNADCDVPVIFGVLTVENQQQALDRVPKGAEFAEAAIKMVQFVRAVKEL